MLKISKPSAHRIDITLSGPLDADTMRSGLESLIEQSKGITQGKMLYKIMDFHMPTMGALAVEFQLMTKLFGLIGKFERCAVQSDAAWIRSAAAIEGALIPSFEVKSFSLSETEAEEAWLEGNLNKDDIAEDEREVEEDNYPV